MEFMENSENQTRDYGASLEDAGITIRLDSFEGPLDLLLHLIRKEEIDIYDIPISRITEQYLEYLQIMRDLNINVAGEWLLMASTLIYIKSRMLVPQEPGGDTPLEEAEDPRQELVYQLLEHQKFKNAAEMLHSREEIENAVWNNPPSRTLEDGSEVIAVSLFDLLRAFHEVVQRFDSLHNMEYEHEEITIEQTLEDIRRRLLVHDKLLFSTFFDEARSKRHLIVVFLALLELVRLREVWLYQERAFDEIHISKLKETA